uniref:AIG1-type G domain-containing protein n=1 Tax=Stegastes partitus TaxID=144197 RepID=A0A3B5ATK1_9TELE
MQGCELQSAESTSLDVNSSVPKNVWITFVGPAARSVSEALSGPSVVVLQEVPRAEEVTAQGQDTVKRAQKVLKSYRIVLLGRSRSGKSSLANTIFGEEVFKIHHKPICGTSECQAESRSIHGRRITLMDTPGFFNGPEEELKLADIVRCSSEFTPGPHVFVIVLKADKFAEQEQDVVTKICKCFSDDVLKYALVVFTHGDQLSKGMKFEEFVDQNEFRADLVKKCGGRCHVVDNRYNQQGGYRSKQFQVEQLLKTVDKMVMENKGGCYTDKMLQAEKRGVAGNRPQRDTSNKEINGASKKMWIKLTGPAAESVAEILFEIVVLGKTGAGKSSLANTIFGENVFKTSALPVSETSECQAKSTIVKGKRVTWIDTPGFFDTGRSEEEMKPAIVKCITESAPGPHIFLIVLKVEKFTAHEKAVIETIKQYFSQEALKYATVLFTHGDQLDEGMEINQFVKQSPDLCSLVESCRGQCNVIDNRYWKNPQDEYRSNEFQVAELLSTIDKIFEANKGGYYSTEMLQLMNKEMIVLLGKAGNGKSSLANTILGEPTFKVNHFNDLETCLSQSVTKSINGRSLMLIDTPGFFGPDRSEVDMEKDLWSIVIECAPGLHAFLLVLKLEKFTEHEQAVITHMCETFSEDALNYTIVVFTQGDQLSEGMKIEEYVDKSDGLRDLVKKCGGRCHIFDSKYWKNTQEDEYRSNQFQVAELLNTIDKIKKNKLFF